MDTIKSLVIIKDVIIIILAQINALKELSIINTEKFPMYANAVIEISLSIELLNKLYQHKVPLEHHLKFALINNLKISLNEFNDILNEFQEWNKNINDSGCCLKIICKNKKKSPVEMKKNLEITFEKINESMVQLNKLEHSILGSAIRINHPILRLAWILTGLNQINDITISKNILIQSLYSLLKKEIPDISNKELKHYLNLINILVNYADTIGGTQSDSLISIFELNQIEITNENSLSVKNLLEYIKNRRINKKLSNTFNVLKIANIIHIEDKDNKSYKSNSINSIDVLISPKSTSE